VERAPENIPATKRPGTHGVSPKISITNKGKS